VKSNSKKKRIGRLGALKLEKGIVPLSAKKKEKRREGGNTYKSHLPRSGRRLIVIQR